MPRALTTIVLSTLAAALALAPVLAQAQAPKPTCVIYAPSASGRSVNLAWQSANATQGSITGVGSVGPSGTRAVVPLPPATLYVGTFTGPGGTATCSFAIKVTASPASAGTAAGSSGILSFASAGYYGDASLAPTGALFNVPQLTSPQSFDANSAYNGSSQPNPPTIENNQTVDANSAYNGSSLSNGQTIDGNSAYNGGSFASGMPSYPSTVGTSPTSGDTIASFVGRIVGIVNAFIPLLVAVAVLIFFVGLIQYIYHAGDSRAHGTGKAVMLWGLVALFVLMSLWGILSVAQSSLFPSA